MIFDYQTFFSQLKRSLFGARGTNRRITTRRLRFFAIFLLLFIGDQLASWLGLALDHLLYPAFRRVDLTGKSLFIVGNFRSGSTFLHRMLAGDESTFTAFTTWEIYLAPSITQRKIFKGLRIVDSWFGSPLYRGLRAWDSRFLQAVPLHSVSLWKPEEDVGLLLYIWYSLLSWFFFPDWEPIVNIVHFDKRISGARRRRVARFYAGCLKRHLFVHGEEKIVVSKNPSFSPMIDTLSTYLPGSKFIGLVRHPVDTVSSVLGWLSFAWHFFADPVEKYPFKSQVIEMIQHFYRCLRSAEHLESSIYRTVRFDALVNDTGDAVDAIYKFIGREMSELQRRNVRRETENAKQHTPDVRTRLELIGIDPRWLAEAFRDTIGYYGFASGEQLSDAPKSSTGSESDVGISPIRAVD